MSEKPTNELVAWLRSGDKAACSELEDAAARLEDLERLNEDYMESLDEAKYIEPELRSKLACQRDVIELLKRERDAACAARDEWADQLKKAHAREPILHRQRNEARAEVESLTAALCNRAGQSYVDLRAELAAAKAENRALREVVFGWREFDRPAWFCRATADWLATVAKEKTEAPSGAGGGK